MSDPTQPVADASGSEAAPYEESVKLLDELEHLKKENTYLRSRVRYLESERSKSKPSKWSKVKGALGWEKETSVTLKVPERAPSDPSSSFSASPAGSCLSQSSLTTPPLPLSSSSSEEDILDVEHQGCPLKIDHSRKKNNESRRSKSLDGEPSLPTDDHAAKASSSKTTGAKGNKTPWSKVKGIINTKTVKKRSASQEERWTRSSMLHEGSGETEEHSQDEDQSGPNSLATPKLTVTLPSNEELTAEPESKKQGWLGTPNRLEAGDVSPGLSRKSKWFKVRNVFLQGSRSAPSSPVRSASFTYEMEGDDVSSGDILDEKDDEIFQDEEHLRYEIEASYIQLQNKLEEEMSKKYCREVNLSPEFKKKLEEWDKMKLQGGTCTTKDWEQDKDRKKKEKWAKGTERDIDRADDDKINMKAHSREGSFKKQQANVGGRQEVLIPTSTGTFRFEGISDNFTQKLYEWEQARGIAPEASTFVLLGPEYHPSFFRGDETGNGGIARSKSIGSIADLGQAVQSLVQQPSSLSLNDMDELSHCAGINRMSPNDVEIPEMLSRGPLFCSTFASTDVPKMGNSDSSNDERDGMDTFRDQVVSSSYQLLQDNITLLDKLKKERDVCRQLEDDMKTLEGQINSVSKSFSMDHSPGEMVDHDDMDRGGCFDDPYELGMCYDNRHLDLIAEEIRCRHTSPLREYTVNLQDFTTARTPLFDDEATQTINFDDDTLAYHICHGFCNGDDDHRPHPDTVQRILSELQDLASRLELSAVNITNSRNALNFNQQFSCDCQRFTSYSLSRYRVGSWKDEVCNVAKLIDDKIQDLRRVLNYETETASQTECNSPPPMQGGLHRSMAHEDLSPGENPGECRSSSRASSSVSSFSYHLSHGSTNSNRHLQDWAPSYAFPHQISYSAFERNSPTMDAVYTLSGSFTDVASDGDASDSGLRVNTPNVLVPTMRKIFSPVGDSEAIGVVIAEEDEASESGKDEPDERDNDVVGESEEDKHSDIFSENEDNCSQFEEGVNGTVDLIDNYAQTDSLCTERPVPILLVPNVKLRAKSSSPATQRKATKFSSVHFFFPTSENGIANIETSPPEVDGLKLGEELSSSLKLRSLRLKKAREEFLMGSSGLNGSMSVIVNDDIINQSPNGLMVKSASEEVVALRVSNSSELIDKLPKVGGVLSLPRMKRRWSREKPLTSAAALARNSSLSSADGSNSHSCPSTPTTEKKTDSGAASWIKNPAKKLFRPKGKYTINN